LYECKPSEIDPCQDRRHLRETADKAKSAIQETAGKLTGDGKLQSEGKIDKAKGAAHKVAGDVKDAVREATNKDHKKPD